MLHFVSSLRRPRRSSRCGREEKKGKLHLRLRWRHSNFGSDFYRQWTSRFKWIFKSLSTYLAKEWNEDYEMVLLKIYRVHYAVVFSCFCLWSLPRLKRMAFYCVILCLHLSYNCRIPRWHTKAISRQFNPFHVFMLRAKKLKIRFLINC